jgi:hypothetical protein
MLRSYIGDRKSGFPVETETGKMLSPANLWRDGFATIVRRWGGKASVSMRSSDSEKRSCRPANAGNSSSIIGWDTRTRRWEPVCKAVGGERKFRAEWAEKVGLGFEIPKPIISEPELIALRALQNQESVVAAWHRISV